MAAFLLSAGGTALASVSGGNVMSLGQSAFNGDGALSDFTLSSSHASVGSFTFFNCTSLKSIVIPASLTQLGDICSIIAAVSRT